MYIDDDYEKGDYIMMSKENRQVLVNALSAKNPSGFFTNGVIQQVSKDLGFGCPSWILNDAQYKVGRGKYNLLPLFSAQVLQMPRPAANLPVSAAPVAPRVFTQPVLETKVENLVPAVDSTYVPFGFYNDLKKIVQSNMFYPVFITGLSGNGKTTMVEQICAKIKREAIRVNISIETDEDDLVGGNTLVDGNVVFREGPVITAMKRGAVLILDEVDRGSNKLMCLQAILEGKPFYNKKTGETVFPAPGFTVVATANTKGRGSDDGKFMSAQILDDAFLERFAITIEQEYPSASVERKIVVNKMERDGCVDEEFADNLVSWAEIIRKTYFTGGVDELISTRRLEHIVKAFSVFGDRAKAIELCVSRFDTDTKTAFLDLYSKVDAKIDPSQIVVGEPVYEEPKEDDTDF